MMESLLMVFIYLHQQRVCDGVWYLLLQPSLPRHLYSAPHQTKWDNSHLGSSVGQRLQHKQRWSGQHCSVALQPVLKLNRHHCLGQTSSFIIARYLKWALLFFFFQLHYSVLISAYQAPPLTVIPRHLHVKFVMIWKKKTAIMNVTFVLTFLKWHSLTSGRQQLSWMQLNW